MATKSKNRKRSRGAKIFCIVLSLVFACGGALTALLTAAKIYTIASSQGMTRGYNSFYDSYLYASRMSGTVNAAKALANSYGTETTFEEYLQSKSVAADKTKAIRAAVNEYLNQKAEIIRGELTYAVNHSEDYDGFSAGEEYYDEELGCTVVVMRYDTYEEELHDYGDHSEVVRRDYYNSTVTAALPEETTAATKQKEANTTQLTAPTTTRRQQLSASSAVQQAEDALATATGTDILQYAYLVRDAAFDRYFSYTYSNGNFVTEFQEKDFDATREQIEKDFSESYDNDRRCVFYDYQNDLQIAQTRLSHCRNLKYYIISRGGEVFTNLNTKPDEKAEHLVLLQSVNGVFTYRIHGTETSAAFPQFFTFVQPGSLDAGLSEGGITDGTEAQILLFSDSFNENDDFQRDFRFFMRIQNFGGKGCITPGCIALFLLLGALIALFCALPAVGIKAGEETVTLRPVDKIPTDISFLISWVLILLAAGLVALGGVAFVAGNTASEDFLQTIQFHPLSAVFTAVAYTLGFAAFGGWVCSVSRIKKAKKSWFGSFLCVRIFVWCFRKIIAGCQKILHLFAYKPRHFARNVIFGTVGFFMGNVIFIAVIAALARNDAPLGTFFTVLLWLGANIALLIRVVRYIARLDKIISASGQNQTVATDESNYPSSLKALADNMNVTQGRLQQAVDAALRDERMKTELITNVSHDLKTPLTGIINYVDLLRRCDITDETALGYLDVLDEKSKRLKSLIEDLVEASKASSGAVVLNRAQINLKELAGQIMGEMNEDFEANQLQIEFTCQGDAPVVNADGQKTYRIIDNLLTNARKYSAPYTRIYIALFTEGNCGIFEIKNISRDKLNVTPQELMERFVRGDEARTDGGNGLGLSIARDLATLQGGELTLAIDGDLFKATLSLPLAE